MNATSSTHSMPWLDAILDKLTTDQAAAVCLALLAVYAELGW